MNKIDAPVCVVDDDESIRGSIEGLLRVEGIPVETYRSAGEFLGRAHGKPAWLPHPRCQPARLERP